MTSEEKLVAEFNEILKEIESIAREYEERSKGWIHSNPERNEKLQRMRAKVAELEQISIDKIKLQRAINMILEKVRMEIQKILERTQLSETEKKIRELLDRMKGEELWTIPSWYLGGGTTKVGYCQRLRELNIEEKDLIEVNERVMELMDRLVKAAEKLE